ncbi:MAG: glycine cleavage system protein GcvH [Roseiflexaceae bacterium]|nr:glycine cleavage system protein GcvH [Roseiflexaceae bacterium]
MAFSTPTDLQYTKSHEWIRIEGDEATIGITDYAQDALGDVVYVELKDVGETLSMGQTFGAVESVKAASDLYMPVDGEIIAVNGDAIDAPEHLNSDPYTSGWLIRIRLAEGTIGTLMGVEAYEKHVDEIKH